MSEVDPEDWEDDWTGFWRALLIGALVFWAGVGLIVGCLWQDPLLLPLLGTALIGISDHWSRT